MSFRSLHRFTHSGPLSNDGDHDDDDDDPMSITRKAAADSLLPQHLVPVPLQLPGTKGQGSTC